MDDSLEINYVIAYPNYKAGDEGKILGKIKKDDLLSYKPINLMLRNTETSEFLNLNLQLKEGDSSLIWKIITPDSSEDLSFMERNMILRKVKL